MMGPSRREPRLTLARRVLVGLVFVGVAATGCVQPQPSPAQTVPEPTISACVERQSQSTSQAEWYEGTCYGWRVGHENVLGGDAYDRNLHLTCEPELFGDGLETSGPPPAGHPTNLDLALARIPARFTVTSHDKWACGTAGLSDHVVLAADGEESESTIDIARWLEGTAWLVVDTLPGSVVGCSIVGRPAVCIDSSPGADPPNTFAFVFVLEDAVLDPTGVVLRISSEEVSLDTLKEIATSIVGG